MPITHWNYHNRTIINGTDGIILQFIWRFTEIWLQSQFDKIIITNAFALDMENKMNLMIANACQSTTASKQSNETPTHLTLSPHSHEMGEWKDSKFLRSWIIINWNTQKWANIEIVPIDIMIAITIMINRTKSELLFPTDYIAL